MSLICEHCLQPAASKTQLFRHLERAHGYDHPFAKPVKVALLVGWLSEVTVDSREWVKEGVHAHADDSGFSAKDPVEQSIVTAVVALESGVDYAMAAADSEGAKKVAFSRCAKTHHQASALLGIEPPTHGVGDVFVVSLKRAPASELQWLECLNRLLPDAVRVLFCRTLPCGGRTFNPEASCCQRRYEYIIPVRHLLAPTCAPSEDGLDKPLAPSVPAVAAPSSVGSTASATLDPASADAELLLQGRKLRATRKEWQTEDGTFPTDCSASQFFRLLKFTMKRLTGTDMPMHNFTTGGACPPGNDETAHPTLRRVDRFHHRCTLVDMHGEKYCVLSVSGDAFTRGQIRGMVGMCLAITRGWLPLRYLEMALGKLDLCNVPTVPGFALYLMECKASAYEAQGPGDYYLDPRRASHTAKGADERGTASEGVAAWTAIVQAHIMHLWRGAAGGECMRAMQGRCQEMCIRMDAMSALKCRTPAALVSEQYRVASGDGDNAEEVKYRRVLQLLQEADRSGLWPASSAGRRKVLEQRGVDAEGNAGGTFSMGYAPPPMVEPKGNSLFPALMRACFELERELFPLRQPSSMIAVNRNAQFRPHRDSGAGNGQSLSLIVALGDFAGGELVVNDQAYNIRYAPFFFDGWSERHATLPFCGQRFSLVWFTPLGVEQQDLWWWKDEATESTQTAGGAASQGVQAYAHGHL
jgi:tRNA pseudouridine(38-40) synthase